MGIDAWLALGVTVAALALLALTRLATHVVLVAALALLLVSDLVPATRALAGFANPGVATIAALFVVVAGVRHSGLLDQIGPWLLGRRGDQGQARVRLAVPTAIASSVLNNTPVVALLIPVVDDWCRRFGVAPAKLLLPVSYAAILGGTWTLIGTSTNLVVDGLMAESGLPRMNLLTPALIGIPVTVAALMVMLGTARWLLPNRQPVIRQDDDPRQFTVEVLVPSGSVVAGCTIAEAGLRHLSAVYLIGIIRAGEHLGVAHPADRLHEGDRLIFAGGRDGVAEIARRKGLTLATDEGSPASTDRGHRVLVEVVVAHHSALLGRTVNQAGLRTHYNAAVVAIARYGQRITGGIGDHHLQAGDILLLEATPAFQEEYAHSPDFYVVSGADHDSLRHHARSPLALLILLGMIVVAASGLLPILSAAVLAAAAMLATGCCSMTQARMAIDGRLLLSIAAAFGLGTALATTGAAATLADSLVSFAAGDPWWTLVMVYVATVLITELVTNNAAAIIMWPIALGSALALQVSVMPFALAIMIGASASFITPLGYQTNLMVYGPGGYRYFDFVRCGVPVALTVAVVALWLIPVFFPFAP